MRATRNSVTEESIIERGCPDLAEALGILFLNNNPVGTLTRTDQELILVGAHAAMGHEADVNRHAESSIQAGASALAVLEAVLTATISRGPAALRTARGALSALITQEQRPEVFSPNGQSPLEYFETQFENTPGWVYRLHAFSPDSLASYALLRHRILADGALSRKTKELLTMLLNAVAGNETGIRSHAAGAMKFGASESEVLSVLVLGIRLGGIVVWINGINALFENE